MHNNLLGSFNRSGINNYFILYFNWRIASNNNITPRLLTFAYVRQFSAYLGLTPKQYSSGGKVNMAGISRQVANKRLRAVLIQGARAYVYKMKEPRTAKDRWLWALIERGWHGRAAVALANKNVRTAWAMLTQGTDYRRKPAAA